MAVKTFKPTSAGLRHKEVTDYSVLTKKAPEKALLEPLKKSGGRNAYDMVKHEWLFLTQESAKALCDRLA